MGRVNEFTYFDFNFFTMALTSESQTIDRTSFIMWCALIVWVNATGLFVDIFTGDSALYAYVSKTMVEKNDFLNLYFQGADWLDKPHFPFWVSALSLKLFGLKAWAYKLPSVLFFTLGLVYTYYLAKSLYTEQIARVSVLILGVSLHLLISNNDVRAEAILIGLIAGGVYHMYRLSQQFSMVQLVLAALFSAAAIMTKGIFVLIVLYSAVGGFLLVKFGLKSILKKRWIVLLLLTSVFTLPELYALYVQFDLHPEKTVFGVQNVSGIKFFLWDSQFGRFFNTGPIKGEGDPFFFIHTLLWAFAPWAIWAIMAVGRGIKHLLSWNSEKEQLTLFGFLVMFLAFSLSRFQLPHYLNILFPFLAILTAAYMQHNKSNTTIQKIGNGSLIIFIGAYGLVIILLEWFFSPYFLMKTSVIMIVSLLIVLYLGYRWRCQHPKSKVILAFFATVIFGLYMNLRFYPTLLTYQSGAVASKWVNQNYPDETVYTSFTDFLMDFYVPLDKLVMIDGVDQLPATGSEFLFFTTPKMAQLMDAQQMWLIDEIKTFEHFHITLLTPEFINKKTREKTLSHRVLLRVKVITKSRLTELNDKVTPSK